MLYLLTCHSLFSCKHHPFLLFNYQRDQGVENRDHMYEPISPTYQVQYWEHSKWWCETKQARTCIDSWSIKQHNDWIAVDNKIMVHHILDFILIIWDVICWDLTYFICNIVLHEDNGILADKTNNIVDVKILGNFTTILVEI